MTRFLTLVAAVVALVSPPALGAVAPVVEASGAPSAAASPLPVGPGAVEVGAPAGPSVLVTRGGATLSLWVPAGTRHEAPDQVGMAATTARWVQAAIEAAVTPAGPVGLELTTTHARFSLPLPPDQAAAIAGRATAALRFPGPAPLQPPPPGTGWLAEAAVGPRLAGHAAAGAADPVAFHARHYAPAGLVAVAAVAAPSEALTVTLTEAVTTASSTMTATPTATTPEASPTAQPVGRPWACLALQGPPPGAWGEEAALLLAGEVLRARLAVATGRRVELALERWPTTCWLLLGIVEPSRDLFPLVEAQVGAMRDDLVDLVELERARTAWAQRQPDPRLDPAALARAIGYDAAVTGVSEGWRREREAVGVVGREEVQAAVQRYGSGEGLRWLPPSP